MSRSRPHAVLSGRARWSGRIAENAGADAGTRRARFVPGRPVPVLLLGVAGLVAPALPAAGRACPGTRPNRGGPGPRAAGRHRVPDGAGAGGTAAVGFPSGRAWGMPKAATMIFSAVLFMPWPLASVELTL